MTLDQIIKQLQLTSLTSKGQESSSSPQGVYCSDLLSCVMSGAPHKSIWITLQCHTNIVAVAALLDLAAVIITENAKPDPETLAKAQAEGVVLLATPKSNYEVCGLLWEMGFRLQ